MDAGILHDTIAEVCPVVSVRVVDANDRGTWSFEPAPEATQAQIDAGNHVIATIPVDAQYVSRFEPTFDMGQSMNEILTSK